ncbi:MAG: hypothetical protein JKX76_03175 [Colwellia sp.]|nr:hypothetical protein [Colwellia sp.]
MKNTKIKMQIDELNFDGSSKGNIKGVVHSFVNGELSKTNSSELKSMMDDVTLDTSDTSLLSLFNYTLFEALAKIVDVSVENLVSVIETLKLGEKYPADSSENFDISSFREFAEENSILIEVSLSDEMMFMSHFIQHLGFIGYWLDKVFGKRLMIKIVNSEEKGLLECDWDRGAGFIGQFSIDSKANYVIQKAVESVDDLAKQSACNRTELQIDLAEIQLDIACILNSKGMLSKGFPIDCDHFKSLAQFVYTFNGADGSIQVGSCLDEDIAPYWPPMNFDETKFEIV